MSDVGMGSLGSGDKALGGCVGVGDALEAECVSESSDGVDMGSGIDGNQQRELDLFAGPAVHVIRIGRWWLACFGIEEPDVHRGIVQFDRVLAVDFDLLTIADVLPMSAIEPAA